MNYYLVCLTEFAFTCFAQATVCFYENVFEIFVCLSGECLFCSKNCGRRWYQKKAPNGRKKAPNGQKKNYTQLRSSRNRSKGPKTPNNLITPKVRAPNNLITLIFTDPYIYSCIIIWGLTFMFNLDYLSTWLRFGWTVTTRVLWAFQYLFYNSFNKKWVEETYFLWY